MSRSKFYRLCLLKIDRFDASYYSETVLNTCNSKISKLVDAASLMDLNFLRLLNVKDSHSDALHTREGYKTNVLFYFSTEVSVASVC